MTEHPNLFADLTRPFAPSEEKTKRGTGYKYITARTVQNRLDEVMGPENWRATFREVDRGVVCELWIRLPSGEWLSKQDAGGHSEMVQKSNGEVVDDDENALKSGYSDALKRAAVAWGIGRYLYGDGQPRYGKPSPARADNESEPPTQARRNGHAKRDDGGPMTGRKLVAWAKQQDEAFDDLGMVNWLAANCKRQWGNGKLMDLTDEQAAQAHKAALRRMAEVRISDSFQEALPPY